MEDQGHTMELRARNRQLSILNAIAKSLNESLDIAQALQGTLTQVADLLGLRAGWIWLLHEETGRPYLAAALHLPPALADEPARMEGDCYCLDTFRQGDLEGAANVNVVRCSRLQRLVDGTDGLRYHASIPLYAHGKKLGVLNVASPDWREMAAADLQLLYTVGDLLGIAIERARLFQQSRQLGALSERNRLAREIHDTLAQGLTAVALQLETADALLETGSAGPAVRRPVQQALLLTQANLEEARRSVLDLRAAPLEGRTLVEALAALAATFEQQQQIPVAFTTVGASRPLPIRVEIGLYRITQEALNNVARHATAGRVSLRLEVTPAQLRLVVEDDGCGFEPDEVPPDRFGLIGLSERAHLLGGQLHLETALGAGTRLEIVIPGEAA